MSGVNEPIADWTLVQFVKHGSMLKINCLKIQWLYGEAVGFKLIRFISTIYTIPLTKNPTNQA